MGATGGTDHCTHFGPVCILRIDPTMTAPLEARSLSLLREGKAVLDDVSFTVSRGEIFALLGGNGAGKSSTLLT